MAIETKPWTREELSRLPNDGNRYEVLDGELLVTPQAEPGHQEVCARLIAALRPFAALHGVGTVIGPGAVPFQQNELQPDVQVIPVERLSLGARWEDLPLPILVIEVLSPGSRRHDLIKKRAAYARLGIAEYWVVDQDEQRVLVHETGSDAPRTERVTLRWQPSPGAAVLALDVRDLLT